MDVDPPPPLSPIHGFIPLEPELPKPPPSLPPPLTASGWPYRQHRLPRRFTDNLPEVLAPVPIHYESQPEAGVAGPACHVLLIVQDRLVTTANSFGVWCEYPCHPTIDPDGSLSLKRNSQILIAFPQMYPNHHLQIYQCLHQTLIILFIGHAKTLPSGELWPG